MASIDSGGGHGGKKSMNQEIPLVPFIDLLLCCVMFLLATAVWNKLAQLEANSAAPGQSAPADAEPPEEQVRLYLQVLRDKYVVQATGSEPVEIAKNGDTYDRSALREELERQKTANPTRNDIIVQTENGVRYEDIIAAMDEAVGASFPTVTLQDASAGIH